MSAIPSDKVIDIYLEVVAGVEPPENEPKRLADFRKILTKEVATARENGWELEVPSEHDPGV
jgi:hypothetical protein